MRIHFNQIVADGLTEIIRTNPIGVAILGTASHDLWIDGSARLSAPGSPARIAPGEFEIDVQTEGELKMLRQMMTEAQKQLDEKTARRMKAPPNRPLMAWLLGGMMKQSAEQQFASRAG
jgi:hypothetical protein